MRDNFLRFLHGKCVTAHYTDRYIQLMADRDTSCQWAFTKQRNKPSILGHVFKIPSRPRYLPAWNLI